MNQKTVAYTAPFLTFMLFLLLPDLLSAIVGSAEDGEPAGGDVRQWVYPLQTLVSLGVLLYFRRQITFGPHTGWLLAVGCGVLGIIVWLLPGHLFASWQLEEGWWKYLGFTARTDGFHPADAGATGSLAYTASVSFRFLRLVLAVPLVEEIFWRGFLMRLLTDMDGDYWQVPFGTPDRSALLGVTAAFVMVHSPADYAGAVVFGLLMYFVAVRTKSLSACIIMHAVANLILGVYVMTTQQWGYW
ncbi:MAG: CAAX prenyl protease-related protein [Planctomycetaceae bacterium]|nr:CAAX prenyl protease-related protein [Planctomycetaceae bacterium]